jgi:hypothetical protein
MLIFLFRISLEFYSFQLMPDHFFRELKQCFLDAYDENADGRIEIGEVRFFFDLKNLFSFYISLVSRNLTN